MAPNATPLIHYSRVQASTQLSDLPAIAQHMFTLMQRNIATDGFVFIDPYVPDTFSSRGCVIASPSYPTYPGDVAAVNQDYVYHWVRDAAITAIELAFSLNPGGPAASSQSLIDYVTFAAICQKNRGAYSIGHACFVIDGQPRPWSEQSDGPALQTLAILQAWPQLDGPTQATALTLIGNNLAYLLGAYQSATTNLWEEISGYSFFARAVQLRCFQAISGNPYGVPVPAATAGAISWLQTALQSHWNVDHYVSILSPSPALPGYDPNIDIVLASIYGAIPCTDTQLLATAALLRRQWADSTNTGTYYPINGIDQPKGLGPMLGRYPGDTYDGDTDRPVPGGHPWAVCTCCFAELYYRLATAINSSESIPFNGQSSPFFAQVGVTARTTWDQAVAALQNAADSMLLAVIAHSDQLELSEQFDGTTGYEKSVSDLTWSYAAFLSAVRAKTSSAVEG